MPSAKTTKSPASHPHNKRVEQKVELNTRLLRELKTGLAEHRKEERENGKAIVALRKDMVSKKEFGKLKLEVRNIADKLDIILSRM